MTTMTTAETRSPASLLEAWHAYTAANPGTRIRDAAEALGVGEAELVAARIGDGVVRLDGRWSEIVADVERVGPVMALTRNESAVHERHGVYLNASAGGTMGLVVGEDIDLRIFYDRWRLGFAVEETKGERTLRSLQFFDADGTAVHKIFLTEASDRGAYEALVGRFTAEDQRPGAAVSPADAPEAERPDADVDADGFRAAWLALEDTHAFFPMLRRFGVSRTQALRFAPAGHAREVDRASLRTILVSVAADATPIMVFVGSPGVIQIHTGPVSRIVPTGAWINVLDPAFNLHVREDRIRSAWVVRKPTVDGIVTSLELFDEAGGTIALLFGKRKPGQPESEAWRTHVARL